MPELNRRSALTAAGLALAAGSIGLKNAPPARAGSQTYDPAGIYLDFDTKSNIGNASNTRLDANGVIQIRRGSNWAYNPVTISQYGLQQFGYYVQTGLRPHLDAALRQAGWLFIQQDRSTGIWPYDFPFSVGGMSETLQPGWGSAMAQGQAISLMTRIFRKFPNSPNYFACAVRALRPLTVDVAAGGFLTYIDGQPHYEEYPTKSAQCLALNGFQFTLIGLHDLRTLDNGLAEQLYASGIESMRASLPKHDAVTTSAYHLGHLTKPPRKVHHADRYHKVHVTLLDAINSFDPSTTTSFYADLWRTYPPMGQQNLRRQTLVEDLVGAGMDPEE